MSFVFFATRTSGKVSRFDQILEFAAIRTDAEFVELARFETASRLLPHIVASPGTLVASRSDASTFSAPSRASHYEMARLIHRNLGGWSPSTFVGFNSLASDEHFLRQCFYQTLHPPYLTSCNGNTRADVAKIIQASLLLAPHALTIPQTAGGEYDIDLSTVAAANGLDHQRNCTAAHAAEAMIGLARLLCDRAPDLWSTAMRFGKKATVADFIETEPIFSLSDFFYGRPYSWLVVLIGANAANNVERYLFNIRIDPDELRGMSDAELRVRLAEVPKPVRVLKINSVPMLTPEDEAPATAAGKEFAAKEINRRASVLRSDKEFCERLIKAFEMSQPPRVTSAHVEEQLYDGFCSDEDVRLMEQFHAAPWERRAAIVSRFGDARLKRLGQRLIHFEKPEALGPPIRRRLDRAVAARLLGLQDDCPWLTLPKAINELDDLIAAATVEDRLPLYSLRRQLTAQIDHVRAQLRA